MRCQMMESQSRKEKTNITQTSAVTKAFLNTFTNEVLNVKSVKLIKVT